MNFNKLSACLKVQALIISYQQTRCSLQEMRRLMARKNCLVFKYCIIYKCTTRVKVHVKTTIYALVRSLHFKVNLVNKAPAKSVLTLVKRRLPLTLCKGNWDGAGHFMGFLQIFYKYSFAEPFNLTFL